MGKLELSFKDIIDDKEFLKFAVKVLEEELNVKNVAFQINDQSTWEKEGLTKKEFVL